MFGKPWGALLLQGDFGKPRPALVIQSDPFAEHSSVTILPITGTLIDAPLLRVTLQPDAQNGLQKVSQVLVDKATMVLRDRVGPVFGRMGAAALVVSLEHRRPVLGLCLDSPPINPSPTSARCPGC